MAAIGSNVGYKDTLEEVSIDALYTTGGIPVVLKNLTHVEAAVAVKSDTGSYIPFVRVIASTGALNIGFGTISTVAGDFSEIATAVGTVIATVTVYARGY